MVEKVRNHGWSFGKCVGRARQNDLFPAHEIPCTNTLYHLLWKGELPVTLFELPEVLNRRSLKKSNLSKQINGKSIDDCLPELADRNAFWHWKSGTVLGERKMVSLRYLPL